jgi:Icc-related predicted phosphoesterase
MLSKIIVVSDLHNDLDIVNYFVKKSIEENAWLFVAGDITRIEYGDMEEMLNLFNKTKTLLIPGNNERFDFLKYFFEKGNFSNVLLKDFDLFELEGKKLLTIPGNSEKNLLNYWDDEKVYLKLKELTNNFQEKVDIVLSHRPPYKILDYGRGSKALRDLFYNLDFEYFICGHTHRYEGELIKTNKKIIMNPGKRGFLIDLIKKEVKKVINF